MFIGNLYDSPNIALVPVNNVLRDFPNIARASVNNVLPQRDVPNIVRAPVSNMSRYAAPPPPPPHHYCSCTCQQCAEGCHNIARAHVNNVPYGEIRTTLLMCRREKIRWRRDFFREHHKSNCRFMTRTVPRILEHYGIVLDMFACCKI